MKIKILLFLLLLFSIISCNNKLESDIDFLAFSKETKYKKITVFHSYTKEILFEYENNYEKTFHNDGVSFVSISYLINDQIQKINFYGNGFYYIEEIYKKE